jgi:ATP-binding cassette subfamily B protein
VKWSRWGENGSGKTTLAKLLAGLFPPTAGAVTWDGTPITQFDDAEVRTRVAVLFQDFLRYQMSVDENIAAGNWHAADDRERLLRAASAAGAAPFVDRLPDGYATNLGPQFLGGVDLSGGQWQRIALARAFFRDASLVILDEPTASLDPRAEADLFDRVRDLFAGRSVLLISHRFATVRMADRIYVLDDGHVVESGTHADLIAQRGIYEELYTLQARAFSGSDA